MLIDTFTLLAASTSLPSATNVAQLAAPGSVVAPAWLLPTAAAVTALIPASMLAVVKGMERDKKSWELDAPDVSESFALSHPNAFCVLDAGAKGAGLFATCDVSKGSYLFDYTGELLSQAEYNARYPSRVSDYTAALRAPGDGTMHFIDGRDEVLGSPSRFMNHNDQRPNVGRRSFFQTDGSPPRILMYALRDLRPGDELEWDYGKGFWDAHGGKVEDE